MSRKMLIKPEDMIGKVYGEWEVLEALPVVKGYQYFTCRCSCGKIGRVLKANLLNRGSGSCGHERSEVSQSNWRKNKLNFGKGAW